MPVTSIVFLIWSRRKNILNNDLGTWCVLASWFWMQDAATENIRLEHPLIPAVIKLLALIISKMCVRTPFSIIEFVEM